MGQLLRAGRKPQTSTLRTVYFQVGEEPGNDDLLIGTVEEDRLASVLEAWNKGYPHADLLLVEAILLAADRAVGRILSRP